MGNKQYPEGYIFVHGELAQLKGLTAAEKLILAYLLGRSKSQGFADHDAQTYIAHKCGCSIATAKRSLKNLKGKGLLTQTTLTGRMSMYEVHLDKIKTQFAEQRQKRITKLPIEEPVYELSEDDASADYHAG